MTPADRGLRRILVALDASRASLEALEAGAAIASRSGAELEALFVEDVDLLRAAGLPCGLQISMPSGTARPLDRRSMESELRAVAARAREAVESAARASGIASSFRVARGRVAVEVLGAARNADLLVLGRVSRRIGSGPGATARAAARESSTPVLVMGREAEIEPPLLVAYDGSPEADRALDLAARLSGDAAGGLVLLLVAGREEDARGLAERARQRLALPTPPCSRWIGGGWEGLVAAARGARSPLVLSGRSPALPEILIEGLLDELEAAVLVVR
jgi:nucleotide-binding universal stress UspA family protein